MIRTLTIDGYRGFDHFEMAGLADVNLLVGLNNSGKTSVLEAILLLASDYSPFMLWYTARGRGEESAEDPDVRSRRTEIEVCHTFHGHTLEKGVEFRIASSNGRGNESVSYTVQETPPAILSYSEDGDDFAGLLTLAVAGKTSDAPVLLPLTSRDGLTLDTIRHSRVGGGHRDERPPVVFIGTESLDPEALGRLWRDIALTPEEERVVRALQSIEPRIARIASVGTEAPARPSDRGGFLVKLKGSDKPCPIGSLGDGIWRMLAIALAAITHSGGVMLIDDIDTGLHYTVMEDMWKLLHAVSREFKVQVFATTHSRDCVDSLAAICRKDSVAPGAVSIQRLEPENGEAVAYSEAEITVAAERHIEVR